MLSMLCYALKWIVYLRVLCLLYFRRVFQLREMAVSSISPANNVIQMATHDAQICEQNENILFW